MKISLKAFLFLIVFVNVFYAQRKYSFNWHEEEIIVDNLARHFTFYIPRECPDNAPAVFVFHNYNSGMGEVFHTGDGFNEWPDLADKEKFVLIAPNGVNPINGDTKGKNQKWNDCRIDISSRGDFSEANDLKFIDELIEWAIRNLSIDENKIYAAGVGNGGMMVYRLAAKLGDKLAGAAVFLANMPVDFECGLPEKPLPIIIMNSKQDPIIPFDGGTITGDRGEVLSTVETLNYWVSLNQLNTQKLTTKFYEDINPDDNSRIIKNEFDRPLENPAVVLNVITNSGHVVPSIKHKVSNKQFLGNQNRDIEAVEEAWKFLKKFNK